ncbi:MAG TPA: helical backbone metal receptor, partial [Bacteroidia bacterium]|nr:helical backbone metal receptor [Bacteroidia bacterium]
MKKQVIDALGNSVTLLKVPERIVSLVPSQTEYLDFLGLKDAIVGITKFCIHPPQLLKSKIVVGGTKNLKIEKIKQLNPDLILANKEENTKEDIENLMNLAPVYVSDIRDFEGAYKMINDIAFLCNKESKASALIESIEESFQTQRFIGSDKKCIYFIWQNPYMLAGKNTFISTMLTKAGFINSIQDSKENYPVYSLEEIKNLEYDFIFLSSEPFPFKEKHRNELQDLLNTKNVFLVNGEMFSWYGSRMKLASKYFQ